MVPPLQYFKKLIVSTDLNPNPPIDELEWDQEAEGLLESSGTVPAANR